MHKVKVPVNGSVPFQQCPMIYRIMRVFLEAMFSYCGTVSLSVQDTRPVFSTVVQTNCRVSANSGVLDREGISRTL